jgi:uroporphyrinogen decarboxylase
MNGKERILCAISHREPDRVPVDLGSTPSSGISVYAYSRLAKALGVTGSRSRVYDVCQMLAQPEDWAIGRFKVDVVDIGRLFNTEDSGWRGFRLSDGAAAEYPVWFRPELMPDGSYVARLPDGEPAARMPSGATFFDQVIFPYIDGYPEDFRGLRAAMGKVHWSAFAHSPWDHAGEPGFWSDLRRRTLEFKNQTDKALVLVCGCNLFEWGTFLRRLDNFLMDLYTEPESVECLLDALLEIHLDTLRHVCESVGDLVDIVRFGDDLGLDSGPFFSPELYRRIFKPRHQALCDTVKKNSRMHTFLHSCGSIYKLVPDLIEAGFEILNPVQTNCADMEPERLKKEFGKDVVFWGGGVDTRNVLNRGTAQQVKDDVKRRLEIFMPGGGFVFSAIHNILSDVPPENILAMFDAVGEYA